MVHQGSCFCGSVKLEVTGSPEGMGYCHCGSCRSWSGGPVNAFTLWKPGAVRVAAGSEHVGTFQKTKLSERQYCKKCGGHLMTNHPPLGLVDVFAATLPSLKFVPGVHVNYAETVLPIRDGLPKLKDFPAELGGSGVAIPE
jgi:hypothetical protein